VPTLWHVLHPSERPAVWKRKGDGYDTSRGGPEIETFGKLPADINDGSQKRDISTPALRQVRQATVSERLTPTRSGPYWSI
jgi:hypothetical protein